METVGDYLTRDRRSDRPALVDATGRTYDAHWLCTSSWKAGNFLRHTGVRRGVTVGVVGNGPIALLSFLGTALLEGTTWFDPPSSLVETNSLRTLVAPADRLDQYDVPSATQRVGYDGQPADPDVHHLDAGLWSENPSFPPIDVEPSTPLLAVDPTGSSRDGTVSHGAAIAAANAIVDEFGIESGTRVVVEEPFSDPRTIVAGVLAPLVSDGVTVLAPADPGSDGPKIEGDVSVTETDPDPVAETRLPLSAVDVSVA